MKLLHALILDLIVSSTVCSYAVEQQFCATTRPLITNLDEVTSLIISLIQSNSLSLLLQDADNQTTELLTKNFSPAEIAFESEIIKDHKPSIVLFTMPHVTQYAQTRRDLEACAQQFKHRCNFIEVDIHKLFKLAQFMRIKDAPTFIFINNRTELNRLTGAYDMPYLITEIESFLQEAELIKNKKQENE